MKKSTKTALILSAILICAGLIIGFIGFSAASYDISRLNTQRFVTESFEITEPFSAVAVSCGMSDVTLIPSDACRVEFTRQTNIKHSVSVEDGILTLREKDERTWFDLIGVAWGDMEIKVYLPAGEYAMFHSESGTGDVEVPSDFGFVDAEIHSGTGSIEFYANVKNALVVSSDTGDITVSRICAESAEISTDTGSINVSDIELNGGLHLESDTGDMDITGAFCSSFYLVTDTGSSDIYGTHCGDMFIETHTGDIYLNSTAAENRAELIATTGDITFHGFDGGTITVITDTGDVRGTLASEKIFFVESDTGDISVPKSLTGGECSITTDTGDITVKIAK